MDLADKLPPELAQFEMNPALAEWVESLLQSNQNLLDKVKIDALKIQQTEQQNKFKETKIQALTLELAYYKRIRFANKSEQFTAEQRELFEESWNTDIIALDVEVELLVTQPKPVKRQGAGRQPLPSHLHVSNIVMSQNPVPAVSVTKISSRLVKMSPNN